MRLGRFPQQRRLTHSADQANLNPGDGERKVGVVEDGLEIADCAEVGQRILPPASTAPPQYSA
eukprot:4411684-Prorocentrum_lima.AAC.1